MDFYKIREKSTKNGVLEIYPDFIVSRSTDLMVRGKTFFAIWNPETELWSTDEYDVQRLVDKELLAYRDENAHKSDGSVQVRLMSDFSTNSWAQYRNYLGHISDNAHTLDERLTFQNTEVKKKDYVSKRLSYPLEQGSIEAFDEIIGTLYDPEERQKLEWAIGAIVSGDAKDIQKFIVLYGEAGGGKSTILNIIQHLFSGYYTTFEAKALTSNGNSFSTESFKGNPLVAIQHDGDLSRIEDNTKLNSIVSHEDMTMNEKYKPSYTSRVNCFLFIGTNKPVKITDGKSGIIRRLIDVRTSGRKINTKRYQALMSQIDFELGAIAFHCLEVYNNMGKNYYSGYKPLDMILQTDVFYNFVESNYYVFAKDDGVTLSQAYEMYKAYCEDALIEFKLPRHKFRDELKNYFRDFSDMTRLEGKQVRSFYSGFITDRFISSSKNIDEEKFESIVLNSETSIFDKLYSDSVAQYAGSDEAPNKKWAGVTTKLSELNTNLLHYVKPPNNHIVIDFDIKDNSGEKSLDLNKEAASLWPPTYFELSKSGKGLHGHYIYDGDVSKLSRIYDDGIEIKIFSGDSSLRRKLTKCNDLPIAHINSGLPLKGEKLIDVKSVKSEKGLRDLITRNLNKEIHPGTKPSIDFIHKILEEAYSSGMKYDLSQLRPKVLTFAGNSSNQSEYCVSLVGKMKFQSDETIEDPIDSLYEDDNFVFFDVEVFPNLFLVNWKYQGDDKQPVRMINPTPQDIEGLMKMKLIGFNNRRYDNHILYARYIGYDLTQLCDLSLKIINNNPNALFREAYNVSYTDVYDFASAANKKSLKKWEIELGLHHQELGMPWDQPVPEDKWHIVADYCDYDVIATEKVFDHLSGDWAARKVLAELSGLSVNDTTNQHTIRIVFGKNKPNQDKFVYTHLSETFPGYTFDNGKSQYRGEDPGEGGYVYAEPGMYENVVVLDVESMHPTSIEELNLLGPYTRNYSDLKKGRVSIKNNDRESLLSLLDGKLTPFVERADSGQFQLIDLSTGLKTALNSAYGLTSASFNNAFKDPRNIDNIVAKRGALFMIDLKFAVQEKGYSAIHIKTDSIKIPNADSEIIEFVKEFGKKYGYSFKHEDTFKKMCLVNDAVYIAKSKDGTWSATGAEFAHPYIFKTLFSKEDITFDDLCETKSVTSALYLDMNESLPDVSEYEKELLDRRKANDQDPEKPIKKKSKKNDLSFFTDEELENSIALGHNYVFVGKIGAFYPIVSGSGGGLLLREKDGKFYSASGAKGYRWMEAEVVKDLNLTDKIDKKYHKELVDSAIDHLSQFGDFDWLVQKGENDG